MLIALRDVSIGDEVVKRGDRVTAAIQAILPPGRIEALKSQRVVEEITDETSLARELAELTERVAALETALARQYQVLDPPAPKRGPGRPRKEVA